jgi:glutamate/tyrosine decarboxylase-like PLP-dependent enzyme
LIVKESDWERVVEAAMEPASGYLASLPRRAVYRPTDPDEIRAVVGGALSDDGVDPAEVVADLARDLEPYVTAHASGRYFGFVIGGLHPAAYGAELLAATWDQNAGLYAVAPGVAIAEEVAAGWVLEVLDLPPNASVGFVTGGQMANFTCLAAARHDVLRQSGWNVEADGLQGGPKINIVVKTERHSTVPRALRHLGLGDSSAIEIPSDAQSRIDPRALRRTLEGLSGPTIISVEAGNVNFGSFDDYNAVADAVDQHHARGNPTWVHVDGAFGLWARAAQSLRHLTDGMERLDSWSTDGHKMLNVGYDSGLAMCKHPAAHRAAMSVQAAYLVQADGGVRDQMDWNPDFSRRARGLGLYGTLKSLARRFAEGLAVSERVVIVNDVVFNQVLVRWRASDGDDDAYTDRLLAAIQADGTAFFSGTTWQGHRYMRISVADWATDESDVDRAIAAVLRCSEDVS